MTKREFIAVASMLAGIYIWAMYGVHFLVYFGEFVQERPLPSMSELLWFLPLICIPLVLVAAVGYLLIFRAWTVAGRLVPEQTLDEARFPCTTHNLEVVGISIVGLMLCVKAAPNLVAAALQLVTAGRETAEESNVTVMGVPPQYVVRQLLSFVLGAILFVKAGALAALWQRWQPTAASNAAE